MATGRPADRALPGSAAAVARRAQGGTVQLDRIGRRPRGAARWRHRGLGLALGLVACAAGAQAEPVPDSERGCLAHGALRLCQPHAYISVKRNGASDRLKPEIQFTVANGGTQPIAVFFPEADPGAFLLGVLPVIKGRLQVQGMPACGRPPADCVLDPRFHPLALAPGEARLVGLSSEGDVGIDIAGRPQRGGLSFAASLVLVDAESHVQRVPLGFPALVTERSYPGDVNQQNARRGGVGNFLNRLVGKPGTN